MKTRKSSTLTFRWLCRDFFAFAVTCSLLIMVGCATSTELGAQKSLSSKVDVGGNQGSLTFEDFKGDWKIVGKSQRNREWARITFLHIVSPEEAVVAWEKATWNDQVSSDSRDGKVACSYEISGRTIYVKYPNGNRLICTLKSDGTLDAKDEKFPDYYGVARRVTEAVKQ